jgi:hypothetical protein
MFLSILVVHILATSFAYSYLSESVSLQKIKSIHKHRIRNLPKLEIKSKALFESLDGNEYVFVPPEVGIEIWAGSAIALIPIIWASYEFYSRIETQKRCLVCNGSGLVNRSKSGELFQNNRQRKCWSCGGFLPWLGRRMFFLSTFSPGNGGGTETFT